MFSSCLTIDEGGFYDWWSFQRDDEKGLVIYRSNDLGALAVQSTYSKSTRSMHHVFVCGWRFHTKTCHLLLISILQPPPRFFEIYHKIKIDNLDYTCSRSKLNERNAMSSLFNFKSSEWLCSLHVLLYNYLDWPCLEMSWFERLGTDLSYLLCPGQSPQYSSPLSFSRINGFVLQKCEFIPARYTYICLQYMRSTLLFFKISPCVYRDNERFSLKVWRSYLMFPVGFNSTQ
jgi:hypothetical protein